MRIHGIVYDTGFVRNGRSTRERFDPDVVARELRIVADDLSADAVRVSGGDPTRLSFAAELAADAGLEVWFSPMPTDLGPEEMLALLAECAERADAVRRRGAPTVLVIGCELSVFGAGFIPGRDDTERLAVLSSADPAVWAELADVPDRMNRFFAEAADTARTRFKGPITYAAGMWEQLDWSPFDLVSVDAYCGASNSADYRARLRAYGQHGKPVVVTEFGCCTYRGAADRGASGWAIVDRDSTPPRLDGAYVRDEAEQAAYLDALLDVFEEEGIDGAFCFTFANRDKPYDQDPRFDLDMASFGIVKVTPGRPGITYPDMEWEPKASFRTLSTRYRAMRATAP